MTKKYIVALQDWENSKFDCAICDSKQKAEETLIEIAMDNDGYGDNVRVFYGEELEWAQIAKIKEKP